MEIQKLQLKITFTYVVDRRDKHTLQQNIIVSGKKINSCKTLKTEEISKQIKSHIHQEREIIEPKKCIKQTWSKLVKYCLET